MKRRTLLTSTATIRVVGTLVLTGAFSVAHPALAQMQEACPLPAGGTPLPDPPVTAQQVQEGSATLEEFALAALAQFKRRTSDTLTAEQITYSGCRLRQEGGPWRSGSTYIVTLTPEGRVFLHAKDMSLSAGRLNSSIYAGILSALGIPRTVLRDLNSPDPPARLRAQSSLLNLLSAEPHAPFDLTSPIPNVRPGFPGASGYAGAYISGNVAGPLVLLTGFDLTSSHLQPEVIDYGNPFVTARHVVDRRTLTAFVTEALRFIVGLQQNVRTNAEFRIAFAKARLALRDPDGPWRHGSVYLYLLDLNSNIILFHGAFPDRFELRPLVATVRDVVTGELVLPQVIEAAKSSPEGGFIEYYFDDPADDTDSADIPKLGYAREFTRTITTSGGATISSSFIIGSGVYLTSPGGVVTDNRLQILPHFANGDGITAEVVLVNVDSDPIRPLLYIDGTDGTSIAPETVVELTGDLEETIDGALTFGTEMAPLGELRIATHGRGELVNGSAKVVADGPVGAMLRLGFPYVGETIVGAATPIGDAVVPVRRQQGGITTGVTIHNLRDEAMEVRCGLMSGGAALEEIAVPLEANGQTSWMIEQAFTAADTSDFAGSVRCTAPAGGLFTAVALEMDAGSRIFTTVPFLEVSGEGEARALHFTHFGNGGGITSELVLLNLETRASGPGPTPFHPPIPPTRPVISFYDPEGNRVAAETVVDIGGELEVTADGALTVGRAMAPLEVLRIATHGRGNLLTGSVKVVSERPVGGMLRFDLPGVGAAVVPAGAPTGDVIFPVQRQQESITTGFAIHNLGDEAMEVHCGLMSAGTALEEVAVALEANGQTSRYIDQAFTEADTADFTGSVRCRAPAGSRFTAVAVETDPRNHIFTTVPVIPVEQRMPQE